MFEVKTMNGSRVTPKMAGIESTAKTTSVDLDHHQHQQERRREEPARSIRTRNCCAVVAAGVTGRKRRASRSSGIRLDVDLVVAGEEELDAGDRRGRPPKT